MHSKLLAAAVVAALAVGPAATALEGGEHDDSNTKRESRAIDSASRLDRSGAGDQTAVDNFARAAGRISARESATSVAPSTVPEIVAPTDAATVGGNVVVEATSTAPVVRFAIQGVGFTRYVAVSNGVATTTFDTYGLNGSTTFLAADCDLAQACNSTADQVSVTVDDGPIVLTQPVDGALVGSSFVAAATVSGGVVEFRVDGTTLATVTAAPYQATISTAGLAPGLHTVQAVQCDSIGTCLGGTSGVATINVSNTSSPSVLSASPSPFSPNGDGRRETATVTYSVDSTQVVKWRVTRGATLVRGPVTIGTRNAGTYSFIWNGKNNAGARVSSGGYTVHLDTTRTVGGTTVAGHAERGLTVDVTAPAARNVSASPGTVFPVRDGYKDATRLRTSLSEYVTRARVEIFSAAGNKIRTLDMGARSAGWRNVNWNGRRADGSLVPAGGYRYRFLLTDIAGNMSTGGKHSVSVSHKKLVKKAGSQTVTPRASDVGALIGYCSAVFYPARPSWPGSYAYLSNYEACWDPYPEEEIAITKHAVTLPAAVKYGGIRVSTYGARDLPGFADSGAVVYVNRGGSMTDFGADLGPAERWYSGDSVSGENFVNSRKFRWWAGTTYGNYYDIKVFKVSYAYYVLV